MDGVEAAYEYEAPQFVDFATAQDDPNASAWFDTKVDDEEEHEGIIEGVTKIEEPAEEAAPVVAEPKKRGNIVTSWGSKKESSIRSEQPKAAATKSVPAPALAKRLQPPKKTQEATKKTTSSTATTEAAKPEMPKKPSVADMLKAAVTKLVSGPKPSKAEATESKKAEEEKPKEGSISRQGSVKIQRSASLKRKAQDEPAETETTSAPAPAAKPKATHPVTPKLMTRERSATTVVKTSEEIEIERIEEAKREAEKLRLQARSSFKKLSNAVEYVPTRSSRPLTQPHGFEFQTDKVIKRRKSTSDVQERARAPSTPARAAKLGMILRSACKPGNIRRRFFPTRLTKPKPFKFASTHHKGGEEEEEKDDDKVVGEPVVPMAEAVLKFVAKTPDRFRMLPANRKDYVPRSASAALGPRPVTVPKTPNFALRNRVRPSKALSSEELEEKMMQELAAKPFKARPVSEVVMTSRGDYGVPRIAKKPTTMPETPHFATDERIMTRSMTRAEQEAEEAAAAAAAFHARPVNKRIFQVVSGLPEKHVHQPTVPHSPAITKSRKYSAAEPAEEQKPQPRKRSATVSEPFNVATRENPIHIRERLAQQQKEQEEEELRRAREFKAQPVPSGGVSDLPHVERKQPTVPHEFKLLSHEMGKHRKEMFETQVKRQQMEERAHRFKAQPAKAIETEGFQVKKSTAPLTEAAPIHLNTDLRSKERQAFDKRVQEEQARKEEEQRILDEQRAAEEAEELKEKRRQLVHKAQPVHHYRNVELKPSDRPLTEPESPAFALKRSRSLRA